MGALPVTGWLPMACTTRLGSMEITWPRTRQRAVRGAGAFRHHNDGVSGWAGVEAEVHKVLLWCACSWCGVRVAGVVLVWCGVKAHELQW